MLDHHRETENRVARFDRTGDSDAADARRLALASERWPSWVGYVVAVALEALLTLFLLAITPVFPLARFPVYYFLSIAAIAYWFGLGPAVTALVLSFAAFTGLFVQPVMSWWPLAESRDGWAAIVAFLTGTLAGGAGALMIRRSRARVQHLAEKLAASNERVTSILESIADAFFALDRDWRFTYVNAEAARLLDRTQDELLGRNVWDEFPEAVDMSFYREYHKALAEHVTVAFEEFYPPLSKWFEVRAYPSAEGLSVYFRDVTERKESEEALRCAEQQRIEFYRRTLLAATGGRLVITGRAEIEAIAGSPLAVWDIERAEDLGTIRHQVADTADAAGFNEQQIARFSMCVGEALTNALKHAGGGTASLHRLPDSLMVVISDAGPGIAELSLPDVALTPGYSTLGTLGMGYKVMLSFADKVYLTTGPDGTTVAPEMKLQPTETSPYVPEFTVMRSPG